MRYYRYTPTCFVEDAFQWEALRKHKGSNYKDIQIVAVTPEADFLAKSSGMSYQSIEDFYHWDELNRLGEENINITEHLCDEFDRILYSFAHKIPSIELVTTKAFFHPIKGFLDSITMRAFPVKSVFKYIQPCMVMCFPQPEYKITGPGLLDKPSLSLTSRIVPMVADGVNCNIEWIHHDTVIAGKYSSSPTVNKLSHTGCISELNINLDARIELFRKAVQNSTSHIPLESDKIILLTDKGLDGFTDKILTLWSNYNQTAIASPGILNSGNIQIDQKLLHTLFYDIGQILWNKVYNTPSIRQLLHLHGIDSFPLIEPLLRLLLTKELLILMFQAPFIENNIKKLNNAVVMIGGMIYGNTSIARACDKYNIPVISNHRGGFIGYNLMPFHERYDLADADYFICSGNGAAHTFKNPSPMAHWKADRKRAIPIPMGACWLDELVGRYRNGMELSMSVNQKTANLKVPSKRKTIMYVMSALLGDNCYIGFIFHPEIWLWRFQYDLVTFFTKFPHIDLILKPPLAERYPQITNPIFTWLPTQRLENVHVFSENIPLEHILPMADAFILDSPSTPLLPLVASEKPFLAYFDRSFFQLVPEASEQLKKRAFYSNNRKDFFYQLENYLNTPDWTSSTPVNDEFLCNFGTHLNDGRSAERTSEFLYKLATDTYN